MCKLATLKNKVDEKIFEQGTTDEFERMNRNFIVKKVIDFEQNKEYLTFWQYVEDEIAFDNKTHLPNSVVYRMEEANGKIIFTTGDKEKNPDGSKRVEPYYSSSHLFEKISFDPPEFSAKGVELFKFVAKIKPGMEAAINSDQSSLGFTDKFYINYRNNDTFPDVDCPVLESECVQHGCCYFNQNFNNENEVSVVAYSSIKHVIINHSATGLSNNCIDIAGRSQGQMLRMNTCIQDDVDQQAYLLTTGQIRMRDNLCWTMDKNQGNPSAGSAVTLEQCDDFDNVTIHQKWSLDEGSNWSSIVSGHNSALCFNYEMQASIIELCQEYLQHQDFKFDGLGNKIAFTTPKSNIPACLQPEIEGNYIFSEAKLETIQKIKESIDDDSIILTNDEYIASNSEYTCRDLSVTTNVAAVDFENNIHFIDSKQQANGYHQAINYKIKLPNNNRLAVDEKGKIFMDTESLDEAMVPYYFNSEAKTVWGLSANGKHTVKVTLPSLLKENGLMEPYSLDETMSNCLSTLRINNGGTFLKMAVHKKSASNDKLVFYFIFKENIAVKEANSVNAEITNENNKILENTNRLYHFFSYNQNDGTCTLILRKRMITDLAFSPSPMYEDEYNQARWVLLDGKISMYTLKSCGQDEYITQDCHDFMKGSDLNQEYVLKSTDGLDDSISQNRNDVISKLKDGTITQRINLYWKNRFKYSIDIPYGEIESISIGTSNHLIAISKTGEIFKKDSHGGDSRFTEVKIEKGVKFKFAIDMYPTDIELTNCRKIYIDRQQNWDTTSGAALNQPEKALLADYIKTNEHQKLKPFTRFDMIRKDYIDYQNKIENLIVQNSNTDDMEKYWTLDKVEFDYVEAPTSVSSAEDVENIWGWKSKLVYLEKDGLVVTSLNSPVETIKYLPSGRALASHKIGLYLSPDGGQKFVATANEDSNKIKNPLNTEILRGAHFYVILWCPKMDFFHGFLARFSALDQFYCNK